MLGLRSEPMQSSITACSTGQFANHLHHRGDELTPPWQILERNKKLKTIDFGNWR